MNDFAGSLAVRVQVRIRTATAAAPTRGRQLSTPHGIGQNGPPSRKSAASETFPQVAASAAEHPVVVTYAGLAPARASPAGWDQ